MIRLAQQPEGSTRHCGMSTGAMSNMNRISRSNTNLRRGRNRDSQNIQKAIIYPFSDRIAGSARIAADSSKYLYMSNKVDEHAISLDLRLFYQPFQRPLDNGKHHLIIRNEECRSCQVCLSTIVFIKDNIVASDRSLIY